MNTKSILNAFAVTMAMLIASSAASQTIEFNEKSSIKDIHIIFVSPTTLYESNGTSAKVSLGCIKSSLTKLYFLNVSFKDEIIFGAYEDGKMLLKTDLGSIITAKAFRDTKYNDCEMTTENGVQMYTCGILYSIDEEDLLELIFGRIKKLRVERKLGYTDRCCEEIKAKSLIAYFGNAKRLIDNEMDRNIYDDF